MTARRRDRAGVLAAGLLALLSIGAGLFVRAHAAAAPAHYFTEDQQVYLAVARAPFTDAPQVRHAPASWRILPPLLARGIGSAGGGAERGFLILMFATFALLPMATLAWCGSLRVSRTSAISCAAVMALAPPVVGIFAWDVVRIDAFGLLLMFVIAAAAVRGRVVTLLAGIAALALTKESALIGAFFALAWALLVNRHLLTPAVACVALAVGIRLLIERAIPPSSVYPFNNLAGFHTVMSSLSLSSVARRALLATAGTWNVIVPVVAVGAAARRWTRRDFVLAGALAVTMAQLLFATDNERVAAAGYPFVLALCAIELDTLPENRRRWAGACLALFQIPWLLEMGRVWPHPPLGDFELPHVPPIRYVEIGIVVLSVGAAAVAAVERLRRMRT